jgi:hypothetical protein
LQNAENGCNKPECIAEGGTWTGTACTGLIGDHCGTPGTGYGELQNNLYFTIWQDTNCNNILDEEPGKPGFCIGTPNSCDSHPDQSTCNEADQGCTWTPPVPGFCIGTPNSCDSHPDQSTCNAADQGCTWTPPVGSTTETVLVDNQLATDGTWALFDNATGTGQPLLASDTKNYCLGVSWNIPISVGNIIQGDSMKGDISFDAIQSRNNPNFECLPPT